MAKQGVVKVDPEIHRLTKIASAISGIKISDILREALVDWLEKNRVQIEKEVTKVS